MPAARLPRWVNRYPPLLTTGTTSAVPLRGVNFARRSGVNIESRLTLQEQLQRQEQETRRAEELERRRWELTPPEPEPEPESAAPA